MPLGFGKKKQPNFKEQVEIQRDAEIVAQEAMSEPNYASVYGTIPFDTRVLDDEKILAFFDDSFFDGNFYSSAYQPLMPFISRLLSIGSLTEREVRLFCMDVDIAAEQAHCLATTPIQDFNIDSLANHIKWRVIGAARFGFLLKTITENRKTLTMLNQEKKKSWWKWW